MKQHRLTYVITLPVFILLALAQTACVTTSGNRHIKDIDLLERVQAGKTRKAEVHHLFGMPEKISFIHNGGEIWHYTYSHEVTTGKDMIPYAKTLLGNDGDENAGLIVTFDRDGVVSHVSAEHGGSY